MAPDEYDVAGAGIGVVEADDAARARPGARRRRRRSRWRSSRPALQRLLAGPPRAARPTAGCASTAHVDEFGRTLGEELLEPTRIYAQDCLGARRAPTSTCTRSATSPAAGWPPTWPGCCRPALRRRRRPRRPGRRTPVFGLIGELGRVDARRAGDDVQHGRRHGRRGRPPRTPTRRSPCSAGRGLARLGVRHGAGATGRASTATPRPRAARVERCTLVGHRADALAASARLLVVVLVVVLRVRIVGVRVLDARRRWRRAARPGRTAAAPASSACRRSKSVCGPPYFNSRATFVCLALARPRPMARPPHPGPSPRLIVDSSTRLPPLTAETQ